MLNPYMPQQEIAIMDAILYIKRPRSVLEFGAGNSTVRWAMRAERWTSIEDDAEWAHTVRAGIANHKAAVVFLVNGDTFGAYTSPVREKYDLIFIDGKYRTECVRYSRQWLEPGGIVILHDALRPEYKEAWDVFPHTVFLGEGNILHNGLLLMWGAV